jgi:hypothetical protein
MADDPKNQPTPSMKDFDYFSSHAKPAKHIDIDSLPESLEEQMEKYRAMKSRGARQVFFAGLFFVVCGWFLWGYRDLIVYITTGSEEPQVLGDVAEIDPVNIPHNAYVKLTGITEHRGMQQKIIRGLNFSQEEFWYFRLLGSRGVWIETEPDPEKYGLATQVTVTGRAVDPRRDRNYDELLATYQAKYFSEERPNMRIIQVGVRPGEGQGMLLVVVAVFLVVAALNVYSIVRYIKQLKQKPPVPGAA